MKIPAGATFHASQGLGGEWWLAMSWPRSKHRYGGSSLIRCLGDEATARAVADEMNARSG